MTEQIGIGVSACIDPTADMLREQWFSVLTRKGVQQELYGCTSCPPKNSFFGQDIGHPLRGRPSRWHAVSGAVVGRD